ncbi:MAG TPA: hypothetical protein VD862_00200 [Candidatus Paceibacterota bacterium]|nr:hypothetical protein [Candidatus Paceibacterota bacterium]
MNKYLIPAALALVPFAALAQYNVQPAASPTPARATATPASSVASPTPSPQGAQVDYYLKIDGVEGESEAKGNVETEWKVEEGEKSTDEPDDSMEAKESGERGGTEDINIGIGEHRAAVDSFFDIFVDLSAEGDEGGNAGILFGSGGSGGDGGSAVADILLQGMQEEGVPTEQISLNFEKITARVRHEVRLFGLIPVRTTADVDVDAEGGVKVRFPWWAVLATGKDAENLGSRTSGALGNVLEVKYEAILEVITGVRLRNPGVN